MTQTGTDQLGVHDILLLVLVNYVRVIGTMILYEKHMTFNTAEWQPDFRAVLKLRSSVDRIAYCRIAI